MITFFTTFENKNYRQANSIDSWKKLGCVSNIVSFSSKQEDDGIDYLPYSQIIMGMPTVSSLFKDVFSKYDTEYFCYLNSDILFLSDFCEAFKKVRSQHNSFSMIGQRHNWNNTKPLDIPNLSDEEIKNEVLKDASLHPKSGVDYFLFSREVFENKPIPNFLIARRYFDHWLAHYPISQGIPVVDATGDIFCIHHEESRSKRESDWSRIPQFNEGCNHNGALFGQSQFPPKGVDSANCKIT
jgi:hypothetical protein